MLWRLRTRQRQDSWKAVAARRGSVSLQIVLWTLWSLAVAAVGYFNWHADLAADRPLDTLGLVIHCVLAGLVGLVVLTMIEMRVEPWRFMDDE